MRNLLLSVTVLAGLILPINAIHAQNTEITATCKDGTSFAGTRRSGACRGHGGVQSWGAPATASPVNALPQPATQPAPSRTERGAPGAGQVWVNTQRQGERIGLRGVLVAGRSRSGR